MPTSSSGTLTREACTLSWTESGSGPAVLFIHGTAASIWGDLVERTASFARAISYERRGFGASHARPVGSLPPHAEDALALLDARQARGAIVVGWSIGGIIAAELAIRDPAAVAGMVLLEPPFWAKKHPDANLISGVVGSILLGLVAGPQRGGRRFNRWVFRERASGNTLDRIEPALRARMDANAAAIGIELRGGTGEHLRHEQLQAINVPVVSFAGTRSQQFLADGAERIARAIPGARFEVLEGASHFLQLERSETIAGTIRGMIEASARRAA